MLTRYMHQTAYFLFFFMMIKSYVSGLRFNANVERYKWTRLLSTNKSMYKANGGLTPFQHHSIADCDTVSNRIKRCVSFLDQSPDPFHCVQTVRSKLEIAGFSQLKESTLWRSESSIKKGGKYFFTRDESSIVAFTVGNKFQPGNAFKIIGAHTDSPNLKIKPNSRKSACGTSMLNVECYGGGLWHTWFDRDLSLAGRVTVRNSRNGCDGFHHRLVKISRPILRIPNLCIHLQTDEERKAFVVNKDEHLAPILCSEVQRALESQVSGSDTEVSPWASKQCSQLLQLLSDELGCAVKDVADFELSLYDTQGAARTGLMEEFLCSSRLDNQASCFVATEALVAHATSPALESDEDISLVALFDHEEVGSASTVGAGSTLVSDAMERISHAVSEDNQLGNLELKQRSVARSFILSVDMAHALHPNYASRHEKSHSPSMNGGVVIKSNANQRYATSGVSGFLARELARQCGVPVQEFSVKNGCPCGSTIGPTLSTNTGIRAVDVGMPQLSMHSIREMMGAQDLTQAARLFEGFFRDFRQVDASLQRSD